jgi:predicted ATPase
MITSITFKKDYRCFKSGESFTLRGGVNIIVGDQGTGKSSLLQLFSDCLMSSKFERERAQKIIDLTYENSGSVFAFDFEHDSPRTKGYFNDKVSFSSQIVQRIVSHGQSISSIVKALPVKNGDIALMDEPDMALSVRSCVEISKYLNEVGKKNQIIASCHNPAMILSQNEVLSLEHRKWMPSKEFLLSHGFQF